MRQTWWLPFRATAGRPQLVRPSYKPASQATLVAQWDAYSKIAIDASAHPQGGGAITGWTDLVGGRVLAPTAANTRPEYRYDSGRRAVFFHNQNTNPDTVADYLTCNTSMTALTTLPLAVFIACGRLRQGSLFDRVLHIGSSDINQGLTFSFNNSSEAMRLFVGTGVASTNIAAGTGVAAGSIYYVGCTSQATITYTNGTAGGTSASVPSFGASAIIAAGVVPGNISFNGPIFEIIVFSGETALTETCRCHTEGYLAHKWGMSSLLPSTHEYRFQAP